MSTYELENTSRAAVTIYSEDGDSMILPIGRHVVQSKFNWNLPPNVRVPRKDVYSVVAPEEGDREEISEHKAQVAADAGMTSQLRMQESNLVSSNNDTDTPITSEASNSKFGSVRRR